MFKIEIFEPVLSFYESGLIVCFIESLKMSP